MVRKALPHLGGAVLALDTNGRVLMASTAACTLWQAAGAELVGDLFPHLFVFDVVSRESGWVQSQWEVILAAAQQQSITLQLQPKEAAARDVVVRIEKAGDNPLSYFAFINLPVPAVAPPSMPPFPPDNFLNQFTERGPLGFFDLNFVKNEVFYSATWKRLLGYTDADLPNTYDSWLTLIHPDDSAAAPDRQSRSGTPGVRQFTIEYRMKHAHGHYVWLQGVGIQLYGPNGSLQRVIGAHLDIGERKDIEEAGARAEDRLQLLSDRGRVGVFDLDFASGFYWLSPGLKALLGYTEAELPDHVESFLRILPMDETTGGLPAYFLAQHPNQATYFDTLRVRHHDGREVLLHAGIVRQISRRKDLQRVVGFAIPMPEALGVSSSVSPGLSLGHLTVLLAELHEGVLLADPDGQVVFLNAKAEQLLGRTFAQIAGQSAADVFRLVHRQTGEAGESPFAKGLTAGQAVPLNNEFALDLGGGPPLPVAYSSRPVLNAGGQPAGVVVVFRNPVEMSLTPEELVRANRFEYLGQLAAGVAQDFNNLLTTILGGVSLAKDNGDLSSLENSERAALAAKALSKQLVTFSKGGTAVRQVVKPADVLAEAIRLAAAGSAARVELNVAPDTATICVDRAQMLQVFQNLIINAIQAMTTGQGQIWLTAGNVTLAAGQIERLVAGTYVAIEVRDNGSGIKPEHLPSIYTPFFTTKKAGSGLGLATARSIVLRHGGQAGVETELGVGSTFTIFLPPAEKAEEAEPRRAPNARVGTGRVLFMDDDEDICALSGGMLESLGYKFDLARNGEEAIQFYKRYLNIGRPYDVVIMDLTIVGGMGGEQTFRQLRDLDPEVCAIMTSGYDNDEMARQFKEMGFYDYLTKPYRIGDLGKSLRKVLGK